MSNVATKVSEYEVISKVVQVRNITADARSPVTESCDGGIQCFLVATGDHHLGTICDEPLGRGQPDATVSSGDDCDFVV